MSDHQTQEYRGNGNHEWETVNVEDRDVSFTDRLRVPGGWLYRTATSLGNAGIAEIPVNVVFVPMPDVVKHKV